MWIKQHGKLPLSTVTGSWVVVSFGTVDGVGISENYCKTPMSFQIILFIDYINFLHY